VTLSRWQGRRSVAHRHDDAVSARRRRADSARKRDPVAPLLAAARSGKLKGTAHCRAQSEAEIPVPRYSPPFASACMPLHNQLSSNLANARLDNLAISEISLRAHIVPEHARRSPSMLVHIHIAPPQSIGGTCVGAESIGYLKYRNRSENVFSTKVENCVKSQHAELRPSASDRWALLCAPRTAVRHRLHAGDVRSRRVDHLIR
jgi:hypothetical protein